MMMMIFKKKWEIESISTQSFDPYMGLDARKPVFGGLRTTQAQTSLSFRTDWSAPVLFAYWKVYLNLLQAKFQYSS